MTSQEETKKDFLEECLTTQKELGKRQREYKEVLSTRLKTRADRIVEGAFEKAIDSLRAERNDLKAQIFVADGKSHAVYARCCKEFIQCNVNCQEHLASEIHKLKIVISNLEREMGRIDKEVYDLNRRTVPDSQFKDHVLRARKKMSMLENRLEVGIRRESGFIATNAALRTEVKNLISYRLFFHGSYKKLVLKLNSDKKYLLDLMEYASNTFDNCISVHEKSDNAVLREAKEIEHAKIEMQALMRKMAASEEINKFLKDKGRQRTLAPMLDKEHRRRDKFRRYHVRKIDLYNAVLNKLLHYTDSHNVESVIEKFQMQESLYYSYFSFANEMSFHVTLLDSAVNRLFSQVNNMKNENQMRLGRERDAIVELEEKLKEKQIKSDELKSVREANDRRLDNLLDGINTIFSKCHGNPAPLMLLLGDHKYVNLYNMRRFLSIIERQVSKIVMNVYVTERANPTISPRNYVVKNIEKLVDAPTLLEDIVLTQQCAECAEGEAFNLDDDAGEGGIVVSTVEDCKQQLTERVNQPEMQYRLHSISQCRLPRSRILAARRNT